MKIAARLLTMLALAGVLATTAEAQSNSASITATAVVLAPLNVTGVNNLVFGNVVPGNSVTVLTSNAGAGRFDILGQASTLVNLAFTLPSNLVNGANSLPIGSYTGLVNTSATCTASGTAFDPSVGTSGSLNGTGGMCVFLGATVTAPAVLAAGTYTGSITLTATY